ncbi:universal stress protein [Propionispira raffinosivorans]|uniref:universal stress protein n=1 Tax=Propionispira raffinosivorans TaxID=86959 RepID=UPI000367FF98|nr:universal stress protein [Propionispira raffinosivorans]
MQAFGRILVPVDGSKNSDKAIAAAVDIASVSHGQIDFLYVAYFNGNTDDPADQISWLPDEFTGSIQQISQVVLQHAVKQISTGSNYMTHTATGIPAKQILKFAKDHASDLIVIGGRGLGIVEGFLLGSVSQEVLEHARCPVLIVK